MEKGVALNYAYVNTETHTKHTKRTQTHTHTQARTLSIVTPPCHHFVQKVYPLDLITSNMFPHFGTTFKKLVEGPLPSPRAQPTTMKLVASILGGSCTNPTPVFIVEDFTGNSGGVVGVHATDVASPFED